MREGKGLLDLNSLKKLLAICTAAALFTTILYQFGLWRLPESYYTDRDDALITFSHVINWFEYGFIGVSPSGERVEGYSTPLHFALYFVAYGLFGMGYSSYIWWQTLIGTYLLGLVIARCLAVQGQWQLWAGSVIVASLLATNTRWLQWHGSGMENPLIEAAMMATIFLLCQKIDDWKRGIMLGLALFILSISRAEAIYYAFPLVVAGYFLYAWPRRVFVPLLSIWLLPLVGIFIMRYAYFGMWLPNTGTAQGIDVAQNLKMIWENNAWRLENSSVKAGEMVMKNWGWLLFPAILLTVWTPPGQRIEKQLALMASLVLALTVVHAFLFGANRLDVPRYATYLAPLCTTALAVALLGSWQLWRQRLLLVGIALPVCIVLGKATNPPLQNICCYAEGFVPMKSNFLAIKEREKIYRPLLLNPDLGLTSYTKDFNFIDAAYLGSTLFAQLNNGFKLRADYVFDIAQPDIIELHWPWSEYQLPLLIDERLNRDYTLAVNFTEKQLPNNAAPAGIYVRRAMMLESRSDSRLLANQLGELLVGGDCTEIVSWIKSQLSVHSEKVLVPELFRYMPEIRQLPCQEEIIALLQAKLSDLHFSYLNSAFSNGFHRNGLVHLLNHSMGAETDASSPKDWAEKTVQTKVDDLGIAIVGNKLMVYAKHEKYFWDKRFMCHQYLGADGQAIDSLQYYNADFNAAELAHKFKDAAICVVDLQSNAQVIHLGQFTQQGDQFQEFWRRSFRRGSDGVWHGVP